MYAFITWYLGIGAVIALLVGTYLIHVNVRTGQRWYRDTIPAIPQCVFVWPVIVLLTPVVWRLTRPLNTEGDT
jgi:hypothetical protein